MRNDNSIQNVNVLDLFLDERSWNLIVSGDKTEEYRLVNRWSILSFINEEYHPCFDTSDFVTDFMAWYNLTKLDRKLIFRNYDVVCLHLGCLDISMTFKIESISVKFGFSCILNWGAYPDKYYFVIKLGERIG